MVETPGNVPGAAPNGFVGCPGVPEDCAGAVSGNVSGVAGCVEVEFAGCVAPGSDGESGTIIASGSDGAGNGAAPVGVCAGPPVGNNTSAKRSPR